MAGTTKREQKRAEDLALGEVVGMSRKSSDGEKAGKSLDGQEESIRETCDDYRLPISDEFLWREAPGMSGKLWWAGGGATGIDGDARRSQKTRPVLTKMVNGIVAGNIRCVVVWSLDRLARHVGIMESLIELMNDYGCLLYDRRGPVDIHSAEGRNNVRNSATAAQYQRERAQVDAPRGVEHNKRKGRIVINANRLGFRAVGKASGEIIHQPAEQDLVLEIFHLHALGALPGSRYELGNMEHGPYSVYEIAELLTARPDLPWIDDVYPARIERDGGGRVIHAVTLYSILSDPIYQGRQKHGGKESPCPIFLKPDGCPVVPEWLYEAVQEKRTAGSGVRGIKKNSYSLSGLIRCGVCGRGMIANATTSGSVLNENGTRTTTPAWQGKNRSGDANRCLHKLPILRIDTVDAYINQYLAPELLAELHARNELGEQTALANERATVARSLSDAKNRLEVELPRYLVRNLGAMDDMAANMKLCLQEEIAGYQARLSDIDRKLNADERRKVADSITTLALLPSAAKRDILHKVLRWVAMVPTNVGALRRGSRNGEMAKMAAKAYSNTRKEYPFVTGRLVFLTTWGTLHTAVIYQERSPNSHMPTTLLRPARADESLGTVNDLPDIEAFIGGIKSSYASTLVPLPAFSMEEMAPGYGLEEGDIALFDVDFDASGSVTGA